MNAPVVTIDGRPGRIFEGEMPQTYCFVPEDCITAMDDGFQVADGDYMRTGWDVRNMRFNDEGLGAHLFPNAHRPVVDLESVPVKSFVRRIEIVRSAQTLS